MGDDIPPNGCIHCWKYRRLTMVRITLVVLWFKYGIDSPTPTNSLLFSYVRVFGQLGYIVGPLLLVFYVLITLYFNTFLLGIAIKEDCKTLGDVGYCLMGTKGRVLFTSFQVLNLFLYLPIVLETIAFSLQYVFNDSLGQCIGYWKIVTFGVLFIALQFVTTWKNVAWMTCKCFHRVCNYCIFWIVAIHSKPLHLLFQI
jgi:hypothetical protein